MFIDRNGVARFDEHLRLLARPAGDRVVVVGATREDREEALASLERVLLIGLPIALLLAALAAYGVATAALRPVSAMRAEAAEISRLGSGRRLPVPEGRDELARLGGTLNEMLDRLERSAERERGFVASASHELRTPLALLRAELELALREGRSPEELREAVASAAAESDRLVQLAEDLLVLARADEGRLPVRPEQLDARRAARHDRAPLRRRGRPSRAASCAWRARTASECEPTASAPSRRSRTSWTTRFATATGPWSSRPSRPARRPAARARPRARLRPGPGRPRLRALHPRRPRPLTRRHRAGPGDRGCDSPVARRHAPAQRPATGAAPTCGSSCPALMSISSGLRRNRAMKITRKHIAVGGLVLAVSAGGVGAAVASGAAGDAQEQVSGAGADRAREAALSYHPGTANSVERDSENGATWEVEVTGTDGKTVDVRLDAELQARRHRGGQRGPGRE